jgi:hypothetical protein
LRFVNCKAKPMILIFVLLFFWILGFPKKYFLKNAIRLLKTNDSLSPNFLTWSTKDYQRIEDFCLIKLPPIFPQPMSWVVHTMSGTSQKTKQIFWNILWQKKSFIVTNSSMVQQMKNVKCQLVPNEASLKISTMKL